MIKGNVINNTNTRRKGSMLQDSLSKIKYLLLLAFLLAIPMKAMAGFSPNDLIDETDTGANRLISYFDEVNRHTYVQVTNTSSSFVDIHVQVFRADQKCSECDFPQTLTPGQTVVYDMEKLPGGCKEAGGNGFVAVSLVKGPAYSLIGMFRILDKNGYEYRTNSADSEQAQFAFNQGENILNFNDVTGNNLSDVVGITYVSLSPVQVYASPYIGTVFGGLTSGEQNLIFDDNEKPNSCSPVIFTCDNGIVSGPNFVGGHINLGIDNSIPNSQGFPSVCGTGKLALPSHSGWLYLPWFNFICDDNSFACPTTNIYFTGFLGLNNGNGRGSMDSWMSSENSPLTVRTKPL